MGAMVQGLESVSGTSGRHVTSDLASAGCFNVRCEISQSRPSSPSLTRGNLRSRGDWLPIQAWSEDGTKRVTAACLLERGRGFVESD